LQEKHQFKLEFVSIAGNVWSDFKYNVIEKTSDEIKSQESRAKEIQDEKKKVEEESGKSRRPSRGRDTKNRWGRPAQRKRYTRRSPNGQRSRLKGVQPATISLNESPAEIPTSQSSEIIKTHQKTDLNRPRKSEVKESIYANNPQINIASSTPPLKEPRGNPKPSIPSSAETVSKPSGKNKDFLKRVTELFSKTEVREEPPPPGSES
ncbi:uncharacterized protein METZ01_LOCUS501497, partial [marine metagenome]